MLVWCDNDPEEGPLHADFRLSGDGEEIGLFGRLAAGNPVIDSYVFGAQTPDISEGRETDGGLPWVFFTEPTPGASNAGSDHVPEVEVLRLQLLPNEPNPFNTTTTLQFGIPFDGHVLLALYDAGGRCVARLSNGEMAAGTHSLTWNGCDGAGRGQPSGVYFLRLVHGGRAVTRKLVLGP